MNAFLIHLAIYFVATVVLIAGNMWLDPSYLWVVWPLLFWGAAVALHAAGMMGLLPGSRGR
jgi:2TM domain